MSQKTIRITGWVLTVILGLLFTFSAFLKLSQNGTALSQAAAFGFSSSTYLVIGIVEITSVVLFIIPRTGILGTLLLVAYLGGAIVTHLQHQQPTVMPLTIQVILWITAIIRFPELRTRLFTNFKK